MHVCCTRVVNYGLFTSTASQGLTQPHPAVSEWLHTIAIAGSDGPLLGWLLPVFWWQVMSALETEHAATNAAIACAALWGEH